MKSNYWEQFKAYMVKSYLIKKDWKVYTFLEFLIPSLFAIFLLSSSFFALSEIKKSRIDNG